MKLWVDTITRYFDKLPTQFIVENTQIKLLEKINTDAKENTFEKMSTTVQEDDKELDEFGISESRIYGAEWIENTYDKHRQNELSKLEQGNRKKQNTEFFLQQNPATSYNKIPNMKSAYAKVRKNDHITIDPEYED